MEVKAVARSWQLNHNPSIEVLDFAQGDQRVVVVNDLLCQPENMVEYAASEVSFQGRAGDFYPGVKAACPDDYTNLLSEFFSVFVQPLFYREMGEDKGGDKNSVRTVSASSDFAMATLPSESLLPIQSIPHFDAVDPHQFAVVHYLFHWQGGGTSFYRHKATGFESLSKDNLAQYQNTLNRQATTEGLPNPGYMRGESSLFEHTGKVNSRFNRAIFYRGNVLHSGDVGCAGTQSEDPKKGRLTITSSFICHPQS
ncbi:DUF6445 family protein [Porticoccus sp. GXU_MW_L64]